MTADSCVHAINENQFSCLTGRLIRAEFREIVATSQHVSQPKGETTEQVLIVCYPHWRRFTWSQKKEFVLICLAKCDIQGGASVLFLQLVGKDGARLKEELQSVPDSVLIDRMGLGRERVLSYRAKLARISDGGN